MGTRALGLWIGGLRIFSGSRGEGAASAYKLRMGAGDAARRFGRQCVAARLGGKQGRADWRVAGYERRPVGSQERRASLIFLFGLEESLFI